MLTAGRVHLYSKAAGDCHKTISSFVEGGDEDQGQLAREMTSIGREQIARLYDLARQRSDESRRVLVENIADLFLTPQGRLNEHQRVLMTDILHKLISDLEAVIRKELAERLVQFDNVPPELMRLLANDQIEIARPILEQCDLLRDEDLIEIVRSRSDEHRLVIAMRAKLSEAVSDAVVDEGSPNVIEVLLKNQNAEISERAMAYLVAESRRVDRFQEPLLSRHDLPPKLAHQMFWWVSAALRRKILADFSELNLADVDTALQEATKSAIEAHDPKSNSETAALALVERLAAAGKLSVGFLLQALRQQKIPVFVAGLAHLADISVKVAWRIFHDEAGESFAVLCRAIDLNRQDFTSLYLYLSDARAGRRVRPTSVVKNILDLYDAISVTNAKAALVYWQRDAAYQEALDDVEHGR